MGAVNCVAIALLTTIILNVHAAPQYLFGTTKPGLYSNPLSSTAGYSGVYPYTGGYYSNLYSMYPYLYRMGYYSPYSYASYGTYPYGSGYSGIYMYPYRLTYRSPYNYGIYGSYSPYSFLLGYGYNRGFVPCYGR